MNIKLFLVIAAAIGCSACHVEEQPPSLRFEDDTYASLNFNPYSNRMILEGGQSSYTILTYFQGYDDRDCLDNTYYRRVKEENARNLMLLEWVDSRHDFLGFYLPNDHLPDVREALEESNWDQDEYNAAHLKHDEGEDFLDGRLYWGAVTAGISADLRMASFESLSEIPCECDYGSLILVMERRWVRYVENVFTGESLSVEAPVVARTIVERTDGVLNEIEVKSDSSPFSYCYRIERANFESSVPFLELTSANFGIPNVRQCPGMRTSGNGFSSYGESISILGEDRHLTLRRYLDDGTDLLMSEYDPSIASDPYGELRPAFREAYIRDYADDPSYAHFSFDVLKPYLLKTD